MKTLHPGPAAGSRPLLGVDIELSGYAGRLPCSWNGIRRLDGDRRAIRGASRDAGGSCRARHHGYFVRGLPFRARKKGASGRSPHHWNSDRYG